MAHFRRIQLRDQLSGELYLHSMPGRNEPLEEIWSDLVELRIDRIVCLAPDEELRRKSPSYAAALGANTVPVDVHRFPITDFGAPDDPEAFLDSVLGTARHLQAGGRMLVHCGAGIGRTGMYATGVLMALGIAMDMARDLVSNAGAGPERHTQEDALRRLEEKLKRRGSHSGST
jgi:protein-tyrosine phosphatase